MSLNEELLNDIEYDVTNGIVKENLTVLPLRDVIIFPGVIYPILIGRNSSLKTVSKAMENDKHLFLSLQKKPDTEDPQFHDINKYGIIAKIMQVLRLPNNMLKVLVEGLYQAKIEKRISDKDTLEAKVKIVNIVYNENDNRFIALQRKAQKLFSEYVKIENSLPPDILSVYESFATPLMKMYYALSNIKTEIEKKQIILNERFLKLQLKHFIDILSNEIQLLKMEDEIEGKIQESIQKTQRKFYIQEQIRALQNELGEDDDTMPELALIKEMIEKANLPEEVKEKADEEYERLKKTPSMSPEFAVNRNYIELLTSLPWNKRTNDIFEINHVKKILDEDHYDLEKPKDRILEFIAVLNLAGALKRQILCFVGPPGVGKTSLAKSIARAMGREFVRFSLGGVRDEAEIRGHRRTYIGAMPGKIIQSMKKAGTVNPVVLLDEIDKMAMDFRGDPSSALLEVLDPEQNVNFQDHYLEVDYDLSNVMFITTANVRFDIPLPLQDRMEIIELNSYLDPEKLEIAKRHIIPKLLSEYGMDKLNIQIKDEAILKLIRQYTREAGVRNLEREIASILRKLAREIVSKYDYRTFGENDDIQSLKNDKEFEKNIGMQKFIIDEAKVEVVLKAPKFKDRKEALEDKLGVATGLAWTSTGGEILPIEVTIMPGTEKLTLTGKLGDVMKESATAALSYVRSNYKELNIRPEFNKKKEIHIHVPEGAIPKDGPSAGMAMTLALISAASGIKLRGDVAMTGEITLRGTILPIGGLKEKLLAARRIGINDVIVPKDNQRDIEDIKSEIIEGLNIHPVENLKDALKIAFNNYD